MNQFDQNWYTLNREKIFNASTLDFIQYPSSDSISYGMEKLHGLGFIDHEYNPTLFGYYATKFRKIRLENIRMILAGYHHGANILDLITISTCLEIGFALGLNKRKYKPRDPLEVGETESYYYYKMLFADEFIEYLFIWNDFMKAIDKIGDQMEKTARAKKMQTISTHYLENWTKTNFFTLSGLYAIIERRDELINDMLTMGLNPYFNGLELPRGTYNLVNILKRNLQEGMEEVRKIKKCIYEGYRFNLCIWNNITKSYVNNHTHNEVTIDSKLIKPLNYEVQNDNDIKQNQPQKIIVSEILVRSSFKHKGMFEFMGGDLSVLDGFVDVDLDFLSH